LTTTRDSLTPLNFLYLPNAKKITVLQTAGYISCSERDRRVQIMRVGWEMGFPRQFTKMKEKHANVTNM
jgi:hypothetical protein